MCQLNTTLYNKACEVLHYSVIFSKMMIFAFLH